MKYTLPKVLCFFVPLLSVISACDDDDQEADGNTNNIENSTCSPADTFVGTHGQLKVEGPDLKNQCGDKVRLKGISSMWLNWETSGYAENAEAMKWMIDNWNIKVIRAAMGVEPGGAYLSNPTRALTQVNTIVQNAIDHGIYVIIDWHAHHDTEIKTEDAVAFFKEMATKWGSYPNVLYETWNEPKNHSWTTEIKPYHETVVKAIREIDPDNIIILGTAQWSQKVEEAADDPVAGTNLMYTLHFYSCDHGGQLIDDAWQAFFSGAPIFVTEWGASTADGGISDKRICSDEADEWFDILDQMNASWVAWKLDDCNDVTCLLNTGAPNNGGWNSYLHGHASYVIGKLKE